MKMRYWTRKRRSGARGSAVVLAVAVAVAVALALELVLPIASAEASTRHGSKSVVISTITNNKLGTLLVSGGKTLYSLKPSKTGCTGKCTTFWPMLVLPAGVAKATAGKGVAANKLGTVTRTHGIRQVTYDGKALYSYVGDKSSGQTNGNGLKDSFGTWSAIVTAKPKTSTSPTSTTSSGGYGSY